MIILGDCLEQMKQLEDNSVDSIVTDPPYGLSFMGKKWDYDVPSKEIWKECLRVLKPGGYLLSFAGTRTQHRMAVNIEEAGFEIRDMIAWVYSTGFPKSLNIQKALQKKCTCGNMVAYDIHRTTQESEHNLRPVQETNISQEISNKQTEREVLQSSLSEQGISSTIQQLPNNEGGGQSSLEGRDNAEKTEGKLQGSDLPKMSREISTDGEEGRIHNATQISNGTAPEQTTNQNGSSPSHRPQSEQQQDREPCAFCKQWGTQEARRYYGEAEGFGSALKPALEPITIARKPLSEKTLVDNFLKWGTGGINIDGSRVGTTGARNNGNSQGTVGSNSIGVYGKAIKQDYNMGRFPANLIHDGSDEVVSLFPDTKSGQYRKSGFRVGGDSEHSVGISGEKNAPDNYGDSGSAARFFYCAKASKADRDEGLEGFEDKENSGSYEFRVDGSLDGKPTLPKKNYHPTVKPTKLMQYLVKLVTPKGGVVLDPFMGSGSTGKACKLEGFDFIGIEREQEYIEIAEARINAVNSLSLF